MKVGDKIQNAVLGEGTVVSVNGECSIGVIVDNAIVNSSENYPIAVNFDNYNSSSLTSPSGTAFNGVFNTEGFGQGKGAITDRQRASKKLNAFIYYGQSLSNGTESERAITLTSVDGNLMVGTTPYGEWTTGGGFSPTTSATFYPLIANEKESPSIGFLNQLKVLMNESKQLSVDQDHLYVAMELGVGARSIEQCISGDAWKRFTTGLTELKVLSDSNNYEVCIAGIIYMQGEDDAAAGNTYDYYYSKLGVLKDQINAYIKTIFTDNLDVDFFLSQTSSDFVDTANTLQIPRAQKDFCANNSDVTFIGPYHFFPRKANGSHMVSNAYRWYGSYTAKIVHEKMTLKNPVIFKITSTTISSNVITVTFDVPNPPLVFTPIWVNTNSEIFDDKGFTVTDTTGTLAGSNLTVVIAGDNVITITCSRGLTGTVYLTLGSNTNHGGKHNIADSGKTLSMYNWEITGITTDPDYIPSLAGKQYQFQNWAALDKITITQ